MAMIDSMAANRDDTNNRFHSRKGAWFDWTLDEEEHQGEEIGNCFKSSIKTESWFDLTEEEEERQTDQQEARFKSKKGAWFDWTMDEEDLPKECSTGKKKNDSCIDWADPRSWQAARTAVPTKQHQSKAPEHTAGKEEHEKNLHAPETAAAVPESACEKGKKRCKQSKAQRVVWCHEHCHKSQNDVRRKTLWQLCRQFGASLVCHKKAAKYEAWLANAAQPNYILITDWREAKPCMEVLSKGFKVTQMIVYCETDATFRKASEWTSNLPLEAGPVSVVQGIQEVDVLLLELLAKQSNIEPEMCSTPSTASDGDCEGMANGMDTDSTNYSEDEAIQPFADVSLTSTVQQVWIPCVPVIAVPVVQVVAPAVNPVVDVLGPVLSTYSAHDLSQALAEATPECYTD